MKLVNHRRRDLARDGGEQSTRSLSVAEQELIVVGDIRNRIDPIGEEPHVGV